MAVSVPAVPDPMHALFMQRTLTCSRAKEEEREFAAIADATATKWFAGQRARNRKRNDGDRTPLPPLIGPITREMERAPGLGVRRPF